MTTPIRAEALKQTEKLKDHHELLKQVMQFFLNFPGIQGAFVSGSTSSGNMDEWSDLDLGFLVQDEATREGIWAERWNWEIAPWVHRFDADHIKPHFVIYLFDPLIHVDLNFYVKEHLPPPAGAPFTVAWDQSGILDDWAKRVNVPQAVKVDLSGIIHEDERFWAWIHYCCGHAMRGEYYGPAVNIPEIRRIVENWQAKLMGQNGFEIRRAETKYPLEFLQSMKAAFPRPEKASIKEAFKAMMENQLHLRQEFSNRLGIQWKTSESAIQKITKMVEGL